MSTMRSALYAWRLLLVIPIVGVLVAVRGLMTGAPGNPALVSALTGFEWGQLQDEQPGFALLVTVLKRHESVALLGWTFWLALTNIAGGRLRSRWVWYGWWTVPVLTTTFMLTGAGVGGGLRGVLIAVTGVAILGLAASWRLFAAPVSQSVYGSSGSTS